MHEPLRPPLAAMNDVEHARQTARCPLSGTIHLNRQSGVLKVWRPIPATTCHVAISGWRTGEPGRAGGWRPSRPARHRHTGRASGRPAFDADPARYRAAGGLRSIRCWRTSPRSESDEFANSGLGNLRLSAQRAIDEWITRSRPTQGRHAPSQDGAGRILGGHRHGGGQRSGPMVELGAGEFSRDSVP